MGGSGVSWGTPEIEVEKIQPRKRTPKKPKRAGGWEGGSDLAKKPDAKLHEIMPDYVSGQNFATSCDIM